MGAFSESVYDLVRQIPLGRVTTYGRIALLIGHPRASRLVGQILGNCRDPEVPCHRVVNRGGGLSEAFSPAGKESHRMLLELEGVSFLPDGSVDMERHMWYGP